MVQTELQQIIMNIHRDNIQKIVVAAVVLINNAPLLLKRTTNDFMGGLVELPSGTVEKNETILNALYREIKEETNCDVIAHTLVGEKTIFFSAFTKASGEEGCLQHTGVLFNIEVSGEPTTQGDGLDSNGAEWVDIDSLSCQNATPFALIGCGKEVISLANEQDYPVDTFMRKGNETRPVNRYPMISGVFLFNSKGNIILQKVAYTKKVDAGKWSYSAGGHVDAGESYEQAALRELAEEMGVVASHGEFVGSGYTLREGKPRAFHHVFQVVSDDPIIFDTTEVAETKEFAVPELVEQITHHPENFKDIFAQIFMKWYEKE